MAEVTVFLQNWRLKLLALVLAVGLLAAVAFSENPVSVKTVQAGITYNTSTLKPELVLINPLNQAGVTVVGPSGSVAPLNADSVRVTVNLARILKAGTYTVVGIPVVSASGVSVQSDSIQIPVKVEDLVVSRPLDVEVRARSAPGWTLQPKPQTRAVCGNATQPCRVSVTAPKSVVGDPNDPSIPELKAYVQVDTPVGSDTSTETNLTIKFEQGGHPVDLTKLTTLPRSGFDPATAIANLEARRGSASKSVNVLVSITGRPACGFRVTSLDINQGNNVATLSGPSDVITKQGDTVQLSPIDITGATSGVASTQNVPVPAGVTSSPERVRVVVSVDRQFDCTAPTPTPAPPVPTPTPTPR